MFKQRDKRKMRKKWLKNKARKKQREMAGRKSISHDFEFKHRHFRTHHTLFNVRERQRDREKETEVERDKL